MQRDEDGPNMKSMIGKIFQLMEEGMVDELGGRWKQTSLLIHTTQQHTAQSDKRREPQSLHSRDRRQIFGQTC